MVYSEVLGIHREIVQLESIKGPMNARIVEAKIKTLLEEAERLAGQANQGNLDVNGMIGLLRELRAMEGSMNPSGRLLEPLPTGDQDVDGIIAEMYKIRNSHH